jgi:hypothetical protein
VKRKILLKKKKKTYFGLSLIEPNGFIGSPEA